jgi:hypothetical protein
MPGLPSGTINGRGSSHTAQGRCGTVLGTHEPAGTVCELSQPEDRQRTVTPQMSVYDYAVFYSRRRGLRLVVVTLPNPGVLHLTGQEMQVDARAQAITLEMNSHSGGFKRPEDLRAQADGNT